MESDDELDLMNENLSVDLKVCDMLNGEEKYIIWDCSSEDSSLHCVEKKEASSERLFPSCKVKQTFTYTSYNINETFTSSRSLVLYYKLLTKAFEKENFTYVFEHLEGSRLVVLLNEVLTQFFCKKLKSRRSKKAIMALQAIHCLISNPITCPDVVIRILAEENFLFYSNFLYNSGNFCFLIKEILNDIVSKVFHKSRYKMWEDSYISWLSNLSDKCFSDLKQTRPSICFHIIAAFLVVGIEALPNKFYPHLKKYFEFLFEAMSRNQLSSNDFSKTWDELMLFYKHWVKYALSYPFLEDLDPSFSKIKFKNCVEPDLSIFENAYVRNKMKHEYIHIKDGYVPCEYPLMPSYSKFLNTSPFLNKKQESCFSRSYAERYTKRDGFIWDVIGISYCEECDRIRCSCVQDYLKSEIRKKRKLSCESDMELDEDKNTSLNEQIKPSHLEDPQMYFNPSGGTDKDMTSEEIAKCYDSLIKRNISYSFSSSGIKKSNETRTLDLTGAFLVHPQFPVEEELCTNE